MKIARKRKSVIIIGSIIIIIAIGVAAFFGVKAIYNNGLLEGKRLEMDEMTEKLDSLGNAVLEREKFQKSLSNLFKDLPSEVDSEGVDSYIEKLQNLINEISVEDVKVKLEEYLSKWQEFKDVYSNEDNNEINENFNQLKNRAEELSHEVKSIFDESIKTTLEAL